MRSLRLREANRAPANAGARLRLRAEVRRSRVAQAGLVVSVGIGAARLRRPQSVTPPATDCGLAPALCPPLRRIGLALEPPPPATAPRPRSGAVPPRRRIGIGLVPRPPRQRFDPALGATTFALTPRSGAVPPLGTTTLALGPRPSLWRRAPGSGWFSCRDAATHVALGATILAWGGCAMRKPSVLVAGGQNRRFFAVSEVRNGRFCRLFA